MKKKLKYRSLLPLYLPLFAALLLTAMGWNRAVTVISAATPVTNRRTIILDPGHGGEDGGAVSCTGVSESSVNLEIALKLEALMGLLGMKTVMIRTTDVSVYTQGQTIAQKKVSDIKERVRIVNSTDQAILVSIHQNYFPESRYSGGQVFYAPTEGSESLAKKLQEELVNHLNPGSRRLSSPGDKIYLLQNIRCPGVLVECGFLSNPGEEALLRSGDYQKKLCCVIASGCSSWLAAQENAPL